ncbi:MAG: Ribosomal large subunit pseudouridine synthase D [Myxococcota bacterium]|nr:Ribosomal large subunit pseudouridine synthase D [Myxococcota bacterium]
MSGAPVQETLERAVLLEEDGRRLDQLLHSWGAAASVRAAAAICAEGLVRINGRKAQKGDRARHGDRVSWRVLPGGAAPDHNLVLDILRETPDWAVVNKTAGMASQPLRPGETGTVANALAARYPGIEQAGFSPRDAGLLHRLDVDTSGVLLAAKTRAAFEHLRGQFEKKTVEKIYLALAAGRLKAMEIHQPLETDPSDPRKVRACGHGPGLVSVVRPLVQTEDRTLAEVRIPTGYRHQIRAHLALSGHPIAGDSLYGGPGPPPHLLHAWKLGFQDPAGGEWVRVEAPPPPWAAALMAVRGPEAGGNNNVPD